MRVFRLNIGTVLMAIIVFAVIIGLAVLTVVDWNIDTKTALPPPPINDASASVSQSNLPNPRGSVSPEYGGVAPDYIIITGIGHEGIQETVTRRMMEGYTLFGGVSIAIQTNGLPMYAQAMIKRRP